MILFTKVCFLIYLSWEYVKSIGMLEACYYTGSIFWQNMSLGLNGRLHPFRTAVAFWGQMTLLRGTIVNRTYGTHKIPYIYLFLLEKFGPIYNGPP